MNSLDISLRDGGDCVSNCGMSEDAFEGKKILVVDDINDQGSTVAWIKKDWESSALPDHPNWKTIWGDTVRFAVLTHNLSSEFKDPDYYVWTVNKQEEDCWLVYPWEDFWL
jgi:hypoxanthine phosphoribosyltransferase